MATITPAINIKNGSVSHLLVIDPAGGLNTVTDVVVTDSDNANVILRSELLPTCLNHTVLPIRITSRFVAVTSDPPPAPAPAPVVIPPSGTISITLTNGPVVQPTLVAYVDD